MTLAETLTLFGVIMGLLAAAIGGIYASLNGRLCRLERDEGGSQACVARLEERIKRIEQDVQEIKQDVRAIRNGGGPKGISR